MQILLLLLAVSICKACWKKKYTEKRAYPIIERKPVIKPTGRVRVPVTKWIICFELLMLL